MLASILDFLLKATRPLFFAGFVAAFLLYVLPDNVLVDLGFRSASAGRWIGLIIQVISGAVLAWPFVDRLWDVRRESASVHSEDRALRAEIRKLSGRAKAALRALSNSGQGSLFAQPTSSHVEELRAAGFIRVDEVGDGWGKYNLTTKAHTVVHSSFEKFHSELEFSDADMNYVIASTTAASQKYRY